jgi:aryl-phospho-beta-D-glucosidase BglC (GH1 family)
MPTKRILLTTFLVLACSAAPALAAPGVQYGLQDDAWLAAGPGPNSLDARMQLMRKLGVKIVRYNLRWNLIAATEPTHATDPNDPSYDWSMDDPVVNALHAYGIPVLLTIYGTPHWANGGKSLAYAPTSAASISAFARAAARHSRGPRNGPSGTSRT